MSTTHANDLPSIAGVLAPVVARFPHRQQKLLIAWAERQAARRYQSWAEQVSDPERAGFLGCAAREEDIAARIEALDPDAARQSGSNSWPSCPTWRRKSWRSMPTGRSESSGKSSAGASGPGKKPGRLSPPRRPIPRPRPCCWPAPRWKTKTRVFYVVFWRRGQGGRGQFTILCSHPSFLRKQESRLPALARWMPDQVRHDGSPLHGYSRAENALIPLYINLVRMKVRHVQNAALLDKIPERIRMLLHAFIVMVQRLGIFVQPP